MPVSTGRLAGQTPRDTSAPRAASAESRHVNSRLGSQIWLERDLTAEEVRQLVDSAADVGFGQLRVFLMWPWIQSESPEHWDFRLFDAVFDAAAEHGIKIKATLTANSGPWWLGTGSVLHSQTMTLDPSFRPRMEAYIAACVTRYSNHPALGQWILWNEPMNPPENPWGDTFVTPEARALWPHVLREKYQDIAELNTRWRTGYTGFDDVPMVTDITHPAHRNNTWRSFGPLLSDYELRSRIIESELGWIADRVREHDSTTPLCANPCQSLYNHAEAGYNFQNIGEIVDVLGATFHAPWSFGFAARDTHSALMIAGLSLLQNVPGAQGAEVTEAQTGNTHYAGHTPLGVSPSQIATTYLAPVLAGAESVTGWCFNTRAQDFEAGEWGLLDDDNRIGPRAHAVTAVARALDHLEDAVGPWVPAPYSAVLVTSEQSQAVEFAFSQVGDSSFNRGADAAPQSAALLTAELLRDGIQAGMMPISGLNADVAADVIVASHLAAWSDEQAARLLTLAERGATVVVDGISGEFDLDARLHRPWPGGMADVVGARSRGLETAHDGTAGYPAQLFGQVMGKFAGVRDDFEITNDAWSPLTEPLFAGDGSPVAWERRWGDGRLVFVAASLAKTILDPQAGVAIVNAVLRQVTDRIPRPCRPLTQHAFVLTIHGENSRAAWGVFAPEVADRGGQVVRLQLPPGEYLDVWTGERHSVGTDGTLSLPALDGIALITTHN
jgi:Beta-galactosidase/Beta-galactosidase trimerisation domain